MAERKTAERVAEPNLEIYRYEVELLEARDLDRLNVLQKITPICVVKIGEEIRKTAPSETGQWHTKFVVFIERPEDVEFQVIHEDALIKNLVALGRAKVPATNLFKVLRDKSSYDAALPLSNSKDGVLDVKLKCRVVRPDKWEQLIKKADGIIKEQEETIKSLRTEVELLRVDRLKNDVHSELRSTAQTSKTSIDLDDTTDGGSPPSAYRPPKLRSGFEAFIYVIKILRMDGVAAGAGSEIVMQSGSIVHRFSKNSSSSPAASDDSKSAESWSSDQEFKFLSESCDPIEFSVAAGGSSKNVIATGNIEMKEFFKATGTPAKSGSTEVEVQLKLATLTPPTAKPVIRVQLTYAQLD
eukprot:TRINITY_DN15377_c0_g1_i1.p1 TRINITY_DN15377_c0_g1~~TRINITY_DN15377_c0_g1_i1.p1  ORF type:complete len:355 (+),score=107.72 TRINITY_DN15377_c0_g1_i1:47-1111(+)